MFHSKCGEHVRLSNSNRTATRVASEFNHGLVFSSDSLTVDELFEIRIDKKTESWIGSLEIGVTTCDPHFCRIPASATELPHGTWILSGKSVLQDGCTILEMYPLNLDKITEGETVGVLRTRNGTLEFFYNGISQGLAASNIPSQVFAVIDVYANVSQITVLPKTRNETNEIEGLEMGEARMTAQVTEPACTGLRSERPVERLRFHERTGTLVKLSCNGRAAERMRPLDEFNNAVVMSEKPLVADTLFEIRIDVLVEKWSGSIEVGVTSHDPSTIDFPTTMTNMGSGTIMMSGCGILTNGKGTKREYGEFNLDELRVGDRIGMMRKSNGDLHYFINGLDQGVAASRVPARVWGVVDLYGMTVKVTIVDRDEREEQNLITRRNTVLRETVMTSLNEIPEEDADDRLRFHPNCGSHAAVINNGITAHRPNALDEFNNAVILTDRPLKVNEVFEVRIDKMVTKWAGSIEIGVTTHAPNKLEYPSTMTNVRSGTWIMTGNGVMHNGTSVIDDYGQNLDKLQAGDRVGVVLREGGCLHFLVNGEDQGEAGTGLPANLYPVIDLYGQATQATIVSHCPSCSPTTPTPTTNSPFYPEIHFHSVHGRNARITNGGKTASRPRAMVEFNDAIVITNRPLRPGEMFSVVVERIVDRWSGSIEAGVTAIKPDELELPGTMTDIDHDTWMLSGFAVMKDGVPLRHGYPLNLDKVRTGSVVGLRRDEDSSLHYFLDGVDQGEACTGLPDSVYPVIDLYGQCAQVSIVSNLEPVSEIDDSSVQQVESRVHSESTVLPTCQPLHKWHETCGKGVRICESVISRPPETAYAGLALSSAPLAPGELFQVSVEGFLAQWAGSLLLGVTLLTPTQDEPLPHRLSSIKQPTWYIQGSDFLYRGEVVKTYYCSSLDWLRPGNTVGVKRCLDSTLHFYIDGVDQGIAATNIPKKVYGVVELYGSTSSVRVVSKGCIGQGDAPLAVHEIESSCEKHTEEECDDVRRCEDVDKSIEDGELLSEVHDLETIPLYFHDCHGRNVSISESRLAAKRVSSYNQGLVFSSRTIPRGTTFQIRIESLNPRWVSSLSIGMTTEAVISSTLPVTALGLKKGTWVISGDTVFHNGHKVRSRYTANLDSLPSGRTVGIMVDEENQLRVFINGIDQGVAASNIPPSTCLPLVDLYGMCDQVCLVSEGGSCPESPMEEHVWSETREKGNLEIREKPGTLRSKSDKINENIQCSSHTSPTANAANTVLFERRNVNESFKSPTVAVRSLGCSLAVTSISPLTIKQPSCGYLMACLRLKASLGLPNGYFTKEVVCCCSSCSGGGQRKGEVPVGWVILPTRRRAESGTESWHVAYLTTHVGTIRTVLDLGHIVLPGETNLIGDLQGRTDRKLEESDAMRLTLSPSLASPTVLYKHQYTDCKTKEQVVGYAALEVLVRPGSYKVASDNEWVTKERNSTSVRALLLRIDSLHS